MRKSSIMLLIVLFAFQLVFAGNLFAQETEVMDEGTAVENEAVQETETAVSNDKMEESPEVGGMEKLAKAIFGSTAVNIFIQGGFTMWPILILLLWAIATIIWKLVSLQYAKIKVEDFLEKLVPLVKDKRYDEAINLCEETRGPVSVIVRMALLKVDKGVEAVEKAIEAASVLEMAFLEKGFVPLNTTINLAPMFGFFGTIIGMITAFDDIAAAGEVDPTIVASGIKIALITTAAGLAVAIPVQFFNNMFMSMVDGMVIDMQKGSERLIETLVENQGE